MQNIKQAIMNKKIIKFYNWYTARVDYIVSNIKERTLFKTNYQSLKKINSHLRQLYLLTGDDQIVSMPSIVNFNITDSCNLACPHCFFHATPEKNKIYNKKHMDLELFYQLAEEALPFATRYSITQTGEPLTIKNLEEIIEKTKRYGAKLGVITNGVLLNEKNIPLIIPVLESIVISMDGATKPVFEKLRKNAKFETVLNNVKLLTLTLEKLSLKKTIPVMINFTLMRSNLYDLPYMIPLAEELRVDVLQVSQIQIADNQIVGEDISFYPSEVSEVLKELETVAEETTIEVRIKLHSKNKGGENNSSVLVKKIINDLPTDYYETQKPINEYIDGEKIEQAASKIASRFMLRKNTVDNISIKENLHISALLYKFKQIKKLAVKRNRPLLSKATQTNRMSKYCKQLETNLNITTSGDVTLCTIQGGPTVGNAKEEGIFEIWNGELRRKFYAEFHSDNQPEICVGCAYNQVVPATWFRSSFDSQIIQRFLFWLKLNIQRIKPHLHFF
jgi:MoaA/NifB/PqqE/SkfB family radical SAM enzyme